jgi:RNA polymerase sigma factor (sigma-70 family)
MASAIADMQTCVPGLRRYASALLRDRDKADDLVQDCLLRALDRLHTRQDGDIRPWLFAIMHELLVGRARRVKLRGVTQTPCSDDSTTPVESASQDDRVSGRNLMRAVDALPEDQRGVLLLVAVEDLSYAETARVLGVPVDTVMLQLSRARETLRGSLSDVAAPALWRVK